MKSATHDEKEDKSRILCIGCRQPCSMSGLCMRMWPDFVDKKAKEKKNARSERNAG